jgi:hypothetical protein
MKRFALIGIGLIAVLAACSTPNSSLPQPSAETTVQQVPTGEVSLEQLGQMTPEQIEKLDLEQLQDIDKKLDAEFAVSEAEFQSQALSIKANTYCGSYTGAIWPNADHTRKCALSIGAETYNTNVRFKFAGPNWSSDGCSTVPDYVFLNACRHHDFAYRNLPKYQQFRTDAMRLQADQRFYSNMKSRCEVRYSGLLNTPKRIYCKGVAYTYYVGVRTLGRPSYYGTTKLFP